MKQTKSASVVWAGREELFLDVELDAHGIIAAVQIRGIGGPQFLELIKKYRQTLPGIKLTDILLPKSVDRASLCFKEAILKLRGEWDYPYKEDELCHCRAVPAKVVDEAICAGAHTPKKVSLLTSASTACGTCRPDVEAMIKYRLG